jgi:hypothetical protein
MAGTFPREKTGSQGGEIGRRARLRIAELRISSACFSFQYTTLFPGKMVFLVERTEAATGE